MKKNSNTYVQGRPARGFTLIELLVVIAIIALLTGIVMTNLVGSKAKARDAKRVSDLGNIQLALELYYDRCKQYPISLNTTSTTDCATNPVVNLGTYITTIPVPPTGTTQTAYEYSYRTVSGNRVGYVIRAVLEKASEVIKDGVPADFMTANPTGMTWSISAATLNCNNTTGLNYCLGSK